MAEVKTVKERLTEIFDDEKVYTEFRDKIKDTILNRLYYSKYKETHFYTSPEVFDQFLDMIIEDMLNDCDFKKYIEMIKKLQNPDEKKVYLYRRDHRPDRYIPNSEIQRIQEKVKRKERLEPEEENKYEEYEQKKRKSDNGNSLAMLYFNGYELSEEQKAKLDEYLGTLMTEEEALEGLKKENSTKIKNLRMRAKNYCLETFLHEMIKELFYFTSNPFELKSHESKVGIFKGTNGSEEFVRVDKSSENGKKHDFDVKSEYIILCYQDFWIDDSYDGYGMRNSHNGSKFLIYMPSRETVYPEGTHLSDLIRMKKEDSWKEQLRNIITSLKSDGAKLSYIKDICGSIIEEEERESK